MKQVSLKLKNYAGGVSIVNNSNLQARILNLMFYAMGGLAFLYVLLLGSMVLNIMERRSLEANARTLSGEVADLELNYLKVSNAVDQSLGSTLGFKEPDVKFATRKSLGSLAVTNNEL